MKKSILITVCFLAICFTSWAGKFIFIPVNETQNLEFLFNNKDLKIHYYCDKYVLATATEVVSFEGVVILDEEAFADVDSYAIVYCFEDEKENYLSKKSMYAETLYSGENFLIVKILSDDFAPAKNDGMVAITNQEARLPKSDIVYPAVKRFDNNIANLISQVSTQSVMSYIQTLQDFGSRNAWNTAKITEARNWLKGEYEALDVDVTLHNYTYSYYGTRNGTNVIAIQLGTELPDEFVVCGAHYDSYTYESQNNAPGADDNASGTAGVLETARILSQYNFKRSIIYCAFSDEEYGLYGSAAYAQKCVNEGKNIMGYFNLDMIGYVHPDKTIHASLISPPSAKTLADFFVDVCNIYFPEIPVSRHEDLTWGNSDHTSFNQKGYKGIWWFEDIDCNSPHIHHTSGSSGCGSNNPCTGNIPCLGDVIGPSVNNTEQVGIFTQMLVASVATMAILDEEILPFDPPTNCAVNYLQDMNLEITWDSPTGNTPDQYFVYRDGEKIAGTVNTDYIDTVEDNETYCYTVTALYGDTESDFSNESCGTVPPLPPLNPPTNCFAVSFEMQITITWDAPEENTPDGYFVYRDSIKIFDEPITTYEFFDSPYEAGEYCYNVTAIYGELESEFSNESCAHAHHNITEYNSNFKIYPNPANDKIFIEGGVINQNVEVIDINGRLVVNKVAESEIVSVDVSNLTRGVYFVRVGKEVVGKFVKE
ncbi:MAG: M20/M25/M40 family metallo-hydrolase [Lentimicrobiaceae bacterium]|nr:M20/M25/M40 family metallo-hydrolase [Lentimicrobiaceae bacterium]